jgi:hypothetical protein
MLYDIGIVTVNGDIFTSVILTALHISILILNITYPGGRQVAISEILNFNSPFLVNSGKSSVSSGKN